MQEKEKHFLINTHSVKKDVRPRSTGIPPRAPTNFSPDHQTKKRLPDAGNRFALVPKVGVEPTLHKGTRF
jgi:hypothetical protein